LNPDIYTVHYEDFVKNPKVFIAQMLERLQLKSSKLVDAFMEKISVENRNNRASSSSKTALSDETKNKIVEIINETETSNEAS
jgi:hypothetical protein